MCGKNNIKLRLPGAKISDIFVIEYPFSIESLTILIYTFVPEIPLILKPVKSFKNNIKKVCQKIFLSCEVAKM